MKRARLALWWLAPQLLFLFLYRYGLRSWFQQDDFAWLSQDQNLHTLNDWLRALFEPRAQGTIRPWSERLFFLLNYRYAGMNPLPFHAWVAGTMALNLVLAQWLVLRLTASRLAALAAAVFWLANPGLATPLCWLSSYNQVLCAFFILAALACLVRALETGRAAWWWAQLAVFVLGFGALEINIIYPALALAVVLLRDRRQWLKTLPAFAISGLYFVLHHSVAPKPASGPYARYWDLDMIPTYVRYWGAALAGGQILPHWRLPSWSWEAAACTRAPILAGLAAFAWRRGGRTAALGAFWFTAAIGPVLPLRDHFSVYYLALPAFGLALILGSFLHFAWPRGWRWRAAAAAVIGLHLYFALPIQQATARWHYERGRRVQGLVEGIWRAHELHPGKTILLTGLDDELYWGGFYDAPHRVLGIPEVFLAPGAEKSITPHASLGEIAQTVAPESMAAQELFWDRAVVYQVDGLRLLNITRRYTKNLPPAWLEARPRLIDAGLPAFDRDLGAGWHAREGNYRWMSQSAVVHLAAPDPSAAFFTVPISVSSILSRSSSAFFRCFSRRSAPCASNCCSATRFASTAFSSASSMPATAWSSSGATSAPSGFFATPAPAASVTLLSVARMFFSVSSRPCSACSVAWVTAWRSWSDCCAVADSNIEISASASNAGLDMAAPRRGWDGAARRPRRDARTAHRLRQAPAGGTHAGSRPIVGAPGQRSRPATVQRAVVGVVAPPLISTTLPSGSSRYSDGPSPSAP